MSKKIACVFLFCVVAGHRCRTCPTDEQSQDNPHEECQRWFDPRSCSHRAVRLEPFWSRPQSWVRGTRRPLSMLLLVLNPAARWQTSEYSRSLAKSKPAGSGRGLSHLDAEKLFDDFDATGSFDDEILSSVCHDTSTTYSASDDIANELKVRPTCQRHQAAKPDCKYDLFDTVFKPAVARGNALEKARQAKEEIGFDREPPPTATLSARNTEPVILAQRSRSTALAYYNTRQRISVTDALQAINVIAFAAINAQRKTALFDLLAKSDVAIRQGQIYRLVTPVFLHGNIPHLLFNTLSLRNVGDILEPHLGAQRFAVTYFASGIAGNALSYFVGRSPLSVGASGAIFGLMGCWMCSLQVNSDYWRMRGVAVRETLNHLTGVCAANLLFGLAPGSNIDNMGHLGGFMGGALAGLVIGPRLHQRWLPSGRCVFIDRPVLPLPRLPFFGDDAGRPTHRSQQRAKIMFDMR